VLGAVGQTSKAKAVELKQRLSSLTGGPERVEFVAAVLEGLESDPAAGVQCLADCFVAAQDALRQAFLRGSCLAAAFEGGAGRASAVADLAAAALPRINTAGAVALQATCTSLWTSLARRAGAGCWEQLGPSPARAAAIRLWARRPEMAPPGASAAPLAKWLAQVEGAESEKAVLLSAVQGWAAQQASVPARVEDVLAALLQGNTQPSIEWLARTAAGPRPMAAWVCSLLGGGVAEAAAFAASALLSACGFADLEAGRAALQLLQDICDLFAARGCWPELASTMLCMVLRWPACPVVISEVESNSVSHTAAAAIPTTITTTATIRTTTTPDTAATTSATTTTPTTITTTPTTTTPIPTTPDTATPDTAATTSAALLASAPAAGAWAKFARHVLLELPDKYPEAPVAAVLPMVLAALPHTQQPGPIGEVMAEFRLRSHRTSLAGAGLRNLGNTCYLNSFLQALVLSDGFTERLFALFPPLTPRASCEELLHGVSPAALPAKGVHVRRALAQVMTRLLVSKSPVNPSSLAAMTPFGLSGRQQDVTELARWLLEQLGDADNPRSLAGRCFGIEAKTTVRCSNCGHAQEKKETFADLCLPVVDAAQESAMPMEGGNNNNSNNNNDNSKDNNMCLETDQPEAKCQKTASRRGVAELLRLYLSEEALPGYRCDSCESVDSSLRQLAVTKPPDHLMVTLSRFAFTADGGQQKVDAFVSVDKALELPLAAPFSEVAEAAHEVATCPMEATASYALYAIVTHIGSTPHSGHYICLGCRSSSVAAGERDGPWQRFDDAAVSALPSEATQEHLDACANGNATAHL
ncbi:unnamed protein product, partial [Polarella glacialis]